MAKVLAVVFPRSDDNELPKLDACGTLPDLVASGLLDGVQVQVLVKPQFAELQNACKESAPTVLYLSGQTNYDANTGVGTVTATQFADGPQPADALIAACSSVPTVYVDSSSQEDIGPKLHAAGVQHAISWPAGTAVPAATAAQFSHTFFSALLHLKASTPEAFGFANHVTMALCGTAINNQFSPPLLPRLHSSSQAALPDNSSVPPPSLPGVDPCVPLATSVTGWADIRLLAPRAELRLLLTGDSSLIDGSRLSYLGEALRALLVFEMRGLTLANLSQCTQTPANLPLGCEALRCEVKTTSGAEVVAILGGQPSVLDKRPLVEHALRMTLVADSLSLQFRLPPPTLPPAQPRYSAAIAGGVPVVDALVLTSVWAVQVLRSLSQMPSYRSLLSLGVAAVGSTATVGLTDMDTQRLRVIVTGTSGMLKPAPYMSGVPPAFQPSGPALATDGATADGSMVAMKNEITAGA